MASVITCPAVAPESGRLQVLLARDPDQDLTYDETTEDMLERSGYGHQKPPGWRPLVWIVLLLVFAGALYVAMQPGVILDLFKAFEPKTAEQSPQIASQAPARQGLGTAEPTRDSKAVTTNVPTPRFHEGQQVTIAPQKASGNGRPSLRGDSAGTRPGPPVQPGEHLTILDGSLVEGTWIYQVRTSRGATGWVSEDRLQTRS